MSESLQQQRLRTMKHGDTFAVFDNGGDALNWPSSPEGIIATRGTSRTFS